MDVVRTTTLPLSQFAMGIFQDRKRNSRWNSEKRHRATLDLYVKPSHRIFELQSG